MPETREIVGAKQAKLDTCLPLIIHTLDLYVVIRRGMLKSFEQPPKTLNLASKTYSDRHRLARA